VNHVVAVDVGGTEIKSALVDSDFNVIATINAPTPKADVTGAHTVKAIAELISQYSKQQTVNAVGLAVPGALDDSKAFGRCNQHTCRIWT